MTISENTARLAKKKIGAQQILDRLEEIAGRREWDFELVGLTKNTRDLLSTLINKVLEKNSITSPIAGFHLFSGLTEVLLNALKGNIRYTVYKNEIMQRITEETMTPEKTNEFLDVILATSPLRDAMQRYIIPEKIKQTVREILKLEEKLRTRKEELTAAENELLQKIREQIRKYDFKISMKMVITDEDFFIRIRNNVPISQKDQDRIGDSRKLHQELFAAGKSAEFFRPENVNETESAGLGIAMVDEGYYNMGLDPLELFNVTTSSRATTVYMRYPLETLRNASL